MKGNFSALQSSTAREQPNPTGTSDYSLLSDQILTINLKRTYKMLLMHNVLGSYADETTIVTFDSFIALIILLAVI